MHIIAVVLEKAEVRGLYPRAWGGGRSNPCFEETVRGNHHLRVINVSQPLPSVCLTQCLLARREPFVPDPLAVPCRCALQDLFNDFCSTRIRRCWLSWLPPPPAAFPPADNDAVLP